MNPKIKELCQRVRQTAYEIHVYHAHGHLEKVYENALAHRLRKAGLDVKQQYPIKVFDEAAPSSATITLTCWWTVGLCRAKNYQSSGRGACGSSSWLLEVRPSRTRLL